MSYDYAEALRLIRKHMQPGDTLGMMFMRVAKALESKVDENKVKEFTESVFGIDLSAMDTEAGEVCDGCSRLLICRHCGKFRSADTSTPPPANIGGLDNV